MMIRLFFVFSMILYCSKFTQADTASNGMARTRSRSKSSFLSSLDWWRDSRVKHERIQDGGKRAWPRPKVHKTVISLFASYPIGLPWWSVHNGPQNGWSNQEWKEISGHREPFVLSPNNFYPKENQDTRFNREHGVDNGGTMERTDQLGALSELLIGHKANAPRAPLRTLTLEMFHRKSNRSVGVGKKLTLDTFLKKSIGLFHEVDKGSHSKESTANVGDVFRVEAVATTRRPSKSLGAEVSLDDKLMDTKNNPSNNWDSKRYRQRVNQVEISLLRPKEIPRGRSNVGMPHRPVKYSNDTSNGRYALQQEYEEHVVTPHVNLKQGQDTVGMTGSLDATTKVAKVRISQKGNNRKADGHERDIWHATHPNNKQWRHGSSYALEDRAKGQQKNTNQKMKGAVDGDHKSKIQRSSPLGHRTQTNAVQDGELRRVVRQLRDTSKTKSQETDVKDVERKDALGPPGQRNVKWATVSKAGGLSQHLNRSKDLVAGQSTDNGGMKKSNLPTALGGSKSVSHGIGKNVDQSRQGDKGKPRIGAPGTSKTSVEQFEKKASALPSGTQKPMGGGFQQTHEGQPVVAMTGLVRSDGLPRKRGGHVMSQNAVAGVITLCIFVTFAIMLGFAIARARNEETPRRVNSRTALYENHRSYY